MKSIYYCAVLALLSTIGLTGCMQMAATAMSTGETSIEDDSYTQVATVTTSKYKVTTGADVLLRGFIPKSEQIQKSELDSAKAALLDDLSEPSYQLYFSMTDNTDWQYWDEARYKINGNLHTIDLNRIASDVDCSQYGCSHYEDVAGEVPRQHLEAFSEEGDTIRVYSGAVSGRYKSVHLQSAEVRDFLSDVDSLDAQYNE